MKSTVLSFITLVVLAIVLSLGPTPSTPTFASPSAVAQASVSINAPPTPLLGENFTFTVTFDNTGFGANSTGYGPFLDVILPRQGADGATTGTADGIDFVGASYLGNPIGNVTRLVIPASGCLTHPFARDTTNTRIQVCGIPGDTFVAIRLPFGSFAASQPPIVVTITAAVSNFADPGVPLNIRARGGFEFGSTALNDPCCDPTVLSNGSPNSAAWNGAPVTPVLMTMAKTSNAPEDGTETATGPNFVHDYIIRVDVAAGQTITNLNVTDLIPPQVAFVSVTTPINPANGTPGVVTTTPPVGVPSIGGQLVINFASVLGQPGNDIEIRWQFFVAEVDGNGNPVLDPTTGDETPINNFGTAIGDWIPADPADAAFAGNAIAPGGAAPLHSLWARSIAAQKSVSIVVDNPPAGPSPGDVLRYTLAFQVSDFFRAGNIGGGNTTLTDIFSDGQQLLQVAPGAVPNFTITDQAGTFGPTNFVTGTDLLISPVASGSTQLIFNVEQALLGQADDGVLVGGCFGVAPPCPIAAPNTAAIGEIVYFTQILEDFTAAGPGVDSSVDLEDELLNNVEASSTIQGSVPAIPAPGVEDDTSGETVTIVSGDITKAVYAFNDVPCGACAGLPLLTAGDRVTFRLTYTVPASDFDNLAFTDYLPAPMFDATQITVFNAVVDAAPPPAGQAKFGPTETLSGAMGVAPALTTDAEANSVTFDYGTFDDPANTTRQVDVLFTATVTTSPFAGSLQITNQAAVAETNTFNQLKISSDIVQFGIEHPILTVRKGLVSSDTVGVVYNPPLPTGITFNPPGSVGLPWTGGTINTNLLQSNQIDSDITSGAVAGTIVTFALVVENVGNADAFDILVRDTFSAGFVIPPTGINLKVVRGDGTVMTFTGNPLDLFGAGLLINDPSPTEGVCQSLDPINGQNILVITYELQVATDGSAAGLLTNNGQVTQFSNRDGGAVNYVQDGGVYRNVATLNTGIGGVGPAIAIFDPTISKIGSLEAGALGLVGENLTWLITITNIGAITGTDIVISDTLRTELQLINADIDRGTTSINGQTVTFTIPTLAPGEVIYARIYTAVLRSPLEGLIENTVTLSGRDQNSALVTRSATARFNLVTGLPATGYAPTQNTQAQESHVVEHILWIMAVTLAVVWGKRLWRRVRM